MSFAVPTDFSATSTVYEPVPADNHIGVCVGVIDLGTHQESFQGGPEKPVRKIKLQFELPGVVRSDGFTAIISATYNYSLNEKATFRKTLDAWLGADWTEKYKGRSWSFLLGTPAMVNVENGPSKRNPGQVSAWIKSVTKFPKGMPAPNRSRDNFFLDLSQKYLPEGFSPWDAETIRKSAEYLAGGFRDEASRPGDARDQTQPKRPVSAPPPGPVGTPASTPEIPEVAPKDIVPLLAKYGLEWHYDAATLESKRDAMTAEDFDTLDRYSIPF